MTYQEPDEFERQLADALQRKEPSAGFEARVLAAAAREKQRKWFWTPPVHITMGLRWAAALAMCAVAAVGIEYHRQSAERAAGEAAKAKVELALKITSEKLRKIQDEINAGDQQ
jgi:hypothetical protein